MADGQRVVQPVGTGRNLLLLTVHPVGEGHNKKVLWFPGHKTRHDTCDRGYRQGMDETCNIARGQFL